MSGDVDVGGVTWPELEVRVHLQQILASKVMSRSESLPSFLRFIVEETLAGRSKRLKARVIAVEALGRDKSFNPKADPIVSIQASRLRRALVDYYEHEGRSDPIRIELPKGSYQPKFGRAQEPVVAGDAVPKLLSSSAPSVAVVPLIELDVGENDYFAVGLTQGLVAAIAAFQELTVISAPPLDVGESIASMVSKLHCESGVRFILSGTLRKTAAAVTLRLQLTDARSAAVVWTEKITRDVSVSALLDLEEELAQQVARTVSGNYGVIARALTSEVHRKRTEDLSVYDAILRFRHYQCVVTNESRDSAIEALEKAVQLEPNDGLCWAMLSEAVCDAYGLEEQTSVSLSRTVATL